MATIGIQQELAENPGLLYRLTVDEYHKMIRSGVLEDGAPYELLDGHVVHKIRGSGGGDAMTISPDHATVVMKLAGLNPKLSKLGCHLRTQQPLTLPPFDEPEPDGAIVAGTIDRYSSRHPGALDVLCVIEVADASLRRDRGYKQKIYANCGIPVYLIINLAARTAQRFTQPLAGKGRYKNSMPLSAGQDIVFPTAKGKDLIVCLRRLLP